MIITRLGAARCARKVSMMVSILCCKGSQVRVGSFFSAQGRRDGDGCLENILQVIGRKRHQFRLFVQVSHRGSGTGSIDLADLAYILREDHIGRHLLQGFFIYVVEAFALCFGCRKDPVNFDTAVLLAFQHTTHHFPFFSQRSRRTFERNALQQVLQLHIVDHLRGGGKKGAGGHIAVLNKFKLMSQSQSTVPALQQLKSSEQDATVHQCTDQEILFVRNRQLPGW